MQIGNCMSSTWVPMKPPKSMSGTKRQNRNYRKVRYRKIGISPMLLFPQDTKFIMVSIENIIPGKKQAVNNETDLFWWPSITKCRCIQPLSQWRDGNIIPIKSMPHEVGRVQEKFFLDFFFFFRNQEGEKTRGGGGEALSFWCIKELEKKVEPKVR